MPSFPLRGTVTVVTLALVARLGAQHVIAPAGERAARFKLDTGKELPLVFAPDLTDRLAQPQTSDPSKTPEQKRKSKQDMSLAVAELQRNPDLLKLFQPEVDTHNAAGVARLLNLTAPSVAQFKQSAALQNDETARRAIDDYNVAYVQTQASWRSDVGGIAGKLQSYLKASDRAKRAVANSAVRATATQAPDSEDEFLAALASVAKLQIERDETARRARQLRAKVTYGAADVFTPDDYEYMLGNLPRVVGFYGSGQVDLIAVGVLVAPNLVLTCNHVAADPRFAHAVARSRSDVHLPAADREFAVQKVVFDPAAAGISTDLALIQVALTNGPAVSLPALTIEAAPQRNTPIYVLAMHRDDIRSLAVYDSAAVLFPAQIPGEALPDLFADTILGLGVRVIAKDLTLDQARDLRGELEKCYGTTLQAAVTGRNYFYSRDFSGHSFRVFGFGSDTVEGNSGGGIFNKSNGHLVGLIAMGVAGVGSQRSADWLKHEMGVPGEVVRDFLVAYQQQIAAGKALPAPNVTFL